MSVEGTPRAHERGALEVFLASSEEISRRDSIDSDGNKFESYQTRPGAFIRDVLKCAVITEQQANVLRSVADAIKGDGPPFIGLPAGHAVGKSFLVARLAIWAGCCFPESVILTTAPTWRQVETILWKEIKMTAAKSNLAGSFLNVEFKLPNGSVAYGISTDQPERMQGYHAPFIVVIMDEAPGIEAQIWEVVLNGLAVSSNVLIVAPGNPLESAGPFFDVCRTAGEDGSRWKVHRLSCLDHPNVIRNEDVIPGAVSLPYVLDTLSKHCDPIYDKLRVESLERRRDAMINSGEIDPKRVVYEVGATVWYDGMFYDPDRMFQSRVLGQFPDDAEDSLISYRLVIDAMARGRKVLQGIEAILAGEKSFADVPEYDPKAECVVAADIARFGPDSTVFVARKGDVVLPLMEIRKSDTVETAKRFVQYYRKQKASMGILDVTALGWGVFDAIENDTDCTDVNLYPMEFGSRPTVNISQLQFANRRAQVFWNLRVMLERGTLCLPQDERLVDQLTSIRYTFDNRGRVVIESKKDMKSRGLPSPDRADALAMVCDESISGNAVDEGNFSDYGPSHSFEYASEMMLELA